jgi:hypothetical protein
LLRLIWQWSDIHEALSPVLYHPSSGLLDGEE